MSTIKADAVTAKSTNTDVVITGAGTGVPDIEANFKVGGVSGVPLASIRGDAIDGTKIADDSINSEHYVAASIDNEHLADDAVGIAELSATGTASSSVFLRGDNTWAAAGGGKILQVISAFDNDYHTYANTSVDAAVALSGMSIAITPSATSSKILLIGHATLVSTSGSYQYTSFYFKRDSTQIAVGDASSWSGGTGAGQSFANSGVTNYSKNDTVMGAYIDSPSSTSSITYTMNGFANHYGSSLSALTLIMNGGGYTYNNKEAPMGTSHMIVMEIDGS